MTDMIRDELTEQLQDLIAQRQTLKSEIDAKKHIIDTEMNATIKVIMDMLGTKSTHINALGKNWSVTISSGQKNQLVATKLLAAGVTEEQLLKGTKRGKPYTSVTVRDTASRKKSDGNGGDDDGSGNDLG